MISEIHRFEMELDPKSHLAHVIDFSKIMDYETDIVYYLQLGNIRLLLDPPLWKKHDLVQLLDDTQRLIDHPDFNTDYANVVFRFCHHTQNADLFRILVKNRVGSETEIAKLFPTFMDEKLLDILIEIDTSSADLTQLIFPLHRRFQLLQYLESKNKLDMSIFSSAPRRFLKNCNSELFRFFYDRYILEGGQCSIRQYLDEGIVTCMSASLMSLLIDEYKVDFSDYLDNILWDRISYGNEKFVKCVYPLISKKIDTKQKLQFYRPETLASVCNSLLSMGADIEYVKEISDESIIDDFFVKHHHTPIEQYVVKKYSEILRNRVLNFYQNKTVTAENGEETYSMCRQVLNESISLEVQTDTVSDVADMYFWISCGIVRYNTGLHICIGNEKVQLIKPPNYDIFTSSRLIPCPTYRNRICFIYNKIIDLFVQDDTIFTDPIKKTLICFCLTYSIVSEETDLLNRKMMIDYSDTILMLIDRNNVEIMTIFEGEEHLFYDTTYGRIRLADILLDAGINKETILINACTCLHAHIVEHLLQKFPYQICINTIHKCPNLTDIRIVPLFLNYLIKNDRRPKEEIIKKLITRNILELMTGNMRYMLVEQYQNVVSSYQYLLENGLDCREYGDSVIKEAGEDGYNHLIYASLPYRLKADKKTIRQDLISLMKSVSNIPLISLYKLFDIIKEILESGAFQGASDDMLTVLQHYQGNDLWKVSFDNFRENMKIKFYAERKIKHRLDQLLHEYAVKIIGPNYVNMLIDDNIF